MKNSDGERAWDILLHQAHEIAERTRERLRDLQRRYQLPELMPDEDDLNETWIELPEANPSVYPRAVAAMREEHGMVRKEPPVSPNSRDVDVMQEIYLKSVGPANLEKSGGDWGIAITQFPCVVGRHPDCPARVDHPMISRRHCSFFLGDDQVWVEDLGSRNGTR